MQESVPLVSVCCITYNHEHYLAEALDSFLKQVTEFPVEILVHEDASTDETAGVLRDYESRFPGRIRGVYQAVNQYSQGVDVSRMLWSLARGKYIAWCEGDDCWIDDQKLQKQVDFMERNPDYTLSVHAAQEISDAGSPLGYVRPSLDDRDFGVPDVLLGGGEMFASSSMLFKRASVHALPAFYENCLFKDYPLVIHLALHGQVRYLSRCMSVYRHAREGWTAKLGRDPQAQLRALDDVLQLLSTVDVLTKGRHHAVIVETSRKHRFARTVLCGDSRRLSDPEFVALYSSQPLPRRVWLQFRTRWPWAASQMSRLRGVLEWGP